MGRYKVKFSKTAAKKYCKLPLSYKEMVDINLLNLVENKNTDIKKIIGVENCYRIRIGKYRILIIVDEDDLIITDIGSRGEIYKK